MLTAKKTAMIPMILIIMLCLIRVLFAGPEAVPAGVEQQQPESLTSTLASPLMLPIYICSVILVAMILEKSVALRQSRLMDTVLMKETADLIGSARVEQAIDQCAKSPTLLGKAWAEGLRDYLHGDLPLGEALTQACLQCLKPLRRRLQVISTLGVIAPLLGLLGTVTGMIMTFMQISIAGGADKARLAAGIGFALFTTAGGLLVSIPAIISNRYFLNRLEYYADETEDAIHRAIIQANKAQKANTGKTQDVQKISVSNDPIHRAIIDAGKTQKVGDAAAQSTKNTKKPYNEVTL